MNQRVRAIIIGGEKLALIRRVKEDGVYYIFPGGGVEEGEDLSQALHREIKEELGIEIEIGELFTEYRHVGSGGEDVVHYFYLCKEIGGTFGAGDGPEYQPNSGYEADGTHDPVWVPLAKLKDINLKPPEIAKKVVEKYCGQDL